MHVSIERKIKNVKSSTFLPALLRMLKVDAGQDVVRQSSLLNEGEVHIWSVSLERDLSLFQSLLQTLSSDEIQKANRYHFSDDRDKFVITRGTVRSILSSYLSMEPDQIHFVYNKYGKPFLEEGQLRFNVSHSRQLALVAVSSGQDVGIDIEFVDPNFDILENARYFFSPMEISLLKSLPEHIQIDTFFRARTRKEASLKALGHGFSSPSKDFAVSLVTGESDISFKTGRGTKARNWSLMSLPSEPNYKAALAVEGKINEIDLFWP